MLFLAALSQNSECFILFYHKIPKVFSFKITKFLMFLAVLSQNSEYFMLFYHKIPNVLAHRITFFLNTW